MTLVETGAIPLVVLSRQQDPVEIINSTLRPVPASEARQTETPGDHRDAIGTITALHDSSIAADGVIYNPTSTPEVKGRLAAGVKLEYAISADGSRTVIEAKSSEFFDD